MSQQRLHQKPLSSMSSSDISKQMESTMSMTDRVHVVRHNNRLPQSRYSPYTLRTHLNKEKEKQKEEVIRLGVELSLFVAEAMFLLSDDLRSMLLFCFCLLTFAGKKDYDGPVVGRLVRVIQYVFITYIKPKNRVYHDDGLSIHVELMKTCPQHFNSGVGGLNSIVSILKNGSVAKSYGFECYNQEMKKLEEKLRSAKEFSEANGFVREEIKSTIVHLWKSLFEATSEVINPNKPILFELFRPVRDEDLRRRLASLLI
ncbi:unnamed protein product [Arabidopsis halleri]